MPVTQVTGSQIKDASVSLTADVTGTLPILNGGTNLTSTGSANSVLTSNGTVWASTAMTVLGGTTGAAVSGKSLTVAPSGVTAAAPTSTEDGVFATKAGEVGFNMKNTTSGAEGYFGSKSGGFFIGTYSAHDMALMGAGVEKWTLVRSGNTIRWKGTTGGYVGLAAGASPSSTDYTLPQTVPVINGSDLTSTTAGVMSWATAGASNATTASSAAINTTETIVSPALTFAVGLWAVGTTIKWTLTGTTTASAANLSTFTVRAGTAGTTADASIGTHTVTSAATGTAIPFHIEILLTVRALSATSTPVGVMKLVNQGITGIAATATAVNTLSGSANLATTTATNINVTYKSAAATTTTTFLTSTVEVLK